MEKFKNFIATLLFILGVATTYSSGIAGLVSGIVTIMPMIGVKGLLHIIAMFVLSMVGTTIMLFALGFALITVAAIMGFEGKA